MAEESNKVYYIKICNVASCNKLIKTISSDVKIIGNLRKMFGNVRLAFGKKLVNLWKSSESGRRSSESYRKSSENRQKRHYVLRQFYIKLKLLGRSEIRNFSSRVENYFAALTREILFNTRR